MFSKLIITLGKTNDVNYGMSSLMQGVLMEHIDSDYAEKLHLPGTNPYSQHLEIERDNLKWVISCMNKEAYEKIICPLLSDEVESIYISHKDLTLKILSRELRTKSYKQLMEETYFGDCPRIVTVNFRTACSFKVNGSYQFYPTVMNIMLSLIKKHDSIDGATEIYTEELAEDISKNVQIIGYHLKSTKFSLEGVKIPSFLGSVTLRIGGPKKFVNLMNMILMIGEYSGVGIKAGIGMGAVEIEQHRKED